MKMRLDFEEEAKDLLESICKDWKEEWKNVENLDFKDYLRENREELGKALFTKLVKKIEALKKGVEK